MVPGLLITGAPGSGKTALAKEIGEQLWRAEVPHAVIDVDELARIRAPVADPGNWTRLTVDNLRAIWHNYAALGIDRVVLAGVIDSADTVEAGSRTMADFDPSKAWADRLGRRERSR